MHVATSCVASEQTCVKQQLLFCSFPDPSGQMFWKFWQQDGRELHGEWISIWKDIYLKTSNVELRKLRLNGRPERDKLLLK